MAPSGDRGPGLNRFEAVVVRYMHDVRTEEFLNIGVVVLCEERGYAGAKFLDQWERVTRAFRGADHVPMARVARAFERECELRTGRAKERKSKTQTRLGPWAPLDFAKVVLHADPDGAIRFSRVLSGPTADPARTLEELFGVHVHRAKPQAAHVPRTDNEVWKEFAARLQGASLLHRLIPHEVVGPEGTSRFFEYAWKSGPWNVAEPVSLDLLDASAIRAKAYEYAGIYSALRPSESGTNAHLLIGLPPEESAAPIKRAAGEALRDLRNGLREEAEVVLEYDAGRLFNKIANDVSPAADAGEL